MEHTIFSSSGPNGTLAFFFVVRISHIALRVLVTARVLVISNTMHSSVYMGFARGYSSFYMAFATVTLNFTWALPQLLFPFLWALPGGTLHFIWLVR